MKKLDLVEALEEVNENLPFEAAIGVLTTKSHVHYMKEMVKFLQVNRYKPDVILDTITSLERNIAKSGGVVEETKQPSLGLFGANGNPL